MAGKQRDEGDSSSYPDEDWSKITDQNERRKVQNRIAQRKFRKYILASADTGTSVD